MQVWFSRAGWALVWVALSLSAELRATSSCAFRLLFTSPNDAPRLEELRGQEELAQVIDVDRALTQLAGSHLTATQAELRKTSDLMDQYFLLGDVGTLINLYDAPVRRVELAFLQRSRNLTNLKLLESALLQFKAGTATDFAGLLGRMGLLRTALETRLAAATDAAKVALIEGEIRKLQWENQGLERLLGQNFDVYREVRRHLTAILTEKDESLLGRVERGDNRAAPAQAMVASAQTPATTSRALPSPIESDHESKQRAANERLSALDRRLELVDGWKLKVDNETATVPELRAALSLAGLLNDGLRQRLAKDSLDETSRKALAEELETLHNRLQDAKGFIESAKKLDAALGVKSGDFALSPHLLPEGGASRPSVKDIEETVWKSRVALRSKALRDLRRDIWNFLDATVFLGFTGSALPAAGGIANGLTLWRSQKPRDFVYGLFRGLYDEHAAKQYFPLLTLLRRARGETAKLATLLENLNAGTRDELLLTLARRTDMKSLWHRIRTYARSTEATDHLKLYDRMLEAEKRARDLGPISAIQPRGTLRYLVAMLLQGSLATALGTGQLARLCGKAIPAVEDPAVETPGAPAAEPVQALRHGARAQAAIPASEEAAALGDMRAVLGAARGAEPSANGEAAARRLQAFETGWRARLCGVL